MRESAIEGELVVERRLAEVWELMAWVGIFIGGFHFLGEVIER